MPQGQLDSIINFMVPVILIIIAIVFVWWKFSEPLKKLAYSIRGLFDYEKDRTFTTMQSPKTIVYDI